jgi:hypothetical protein
MVKLMLDDDGPGSHEAIVEYVQRVIEQRTAVNDDTTAARLARGITISVLSRLGFGYSVATGAGRPEASAEDIDNAIAALRALAEDEREPERYRESYAQSLAAFEALRRGHGPDPA